MKKLKQYKYFLFYLIPILFPLFIFTSVEFMLRVSHIDFIRPIRVAFSGPRAEDFREYHMFTDEYFMPDPYLFWKIKPTTPVKPKSYAGRECNYEKSLDVFRIFCLGDSFTMGTMDFSYPQELNELLNRNPIVDKKFEVINAGLSGYSSLQGYRLFMEIITCKPDLVIVCFGWNDGCFTKRGADKKFRPPPKFILQLERFCYKLKMYHLLKLAYFKLKYAKQNKAKNQYLSRRVGVEDYRENLIAIIELADKNGVRAILAARPYMLEKEPWMGSFIDDTKAYNEIMREVSISHQAYLLDAEKIFQDHPEYFVDACHMNQQGYTMVAKQLYEILRNNIL